MRKCNYVVRFQKKQTSLNHPKISMYRFWCNVMWDLWRNRKDEIFGPTRYNSKKRLYSVYFWKKDYKTRNIQQRLEK